MRKGFCYHATIGLSSHFEECVETADFKIKTFTLNAEQKKRI